MNHKTCAAFLVLKISWMEHRPRLSLVGSCLVSRGWEVGRHRTGLDSGGLFFRVVGGRREKWRNDEELRPWKIGENTANLEFFPDAWDLPPKPWILFGGFLLVFHFNAQNCSWAMRCVNDCVHAQRISVESEGLVTSGDWNPGWGVDPTNTRQNSKARFRGCKLPLVN